MHQDPLSLDISNRLDIDLDSLSIISLHSKAISVKKKLLYLGKEMINIKLNLLMPGLHTNI